MTACVMSHLSKYVQSILYPEQPSEHQVVDKEEKIKQWFDGDIQVIGKMSLFQFENGITIRKIEEHDATAIEIEACREHWISYEVVDHQHRLEHITPKRIQFNSTCREEFWLKYFQDENV